MPLINQIRIARRFQRSIRIDTDLGEAKALEGFICPQSSAKVLQTMAHHIAETGQGAFTWTGPYGSGKSSLVIALSALLNGNLDLRKYATDVFGQNLTTAIWKALPTGTNGWLIIPVVGRRGDAVSAIGEALHTAGLISRKPRGGWTEDRVISTLKEALSCSENHDGIILFVDEMGKFLESAAHEASDIYVFQQLAEAASRSNGRLILVGILHQAFEEYAYRLSHEMRDEWSKIQGRFIDLAVNASGDEQIDLISRAIEPVSANQKSKTPRRLAHMVAELARREQSVDVQRLTLTLESCWPLHPVVACLLAPISRRRFGQNQRSIFGFLNSAEPHGFQDFLMCGDEQDLYQPYRLWDYLRANLEPSILASPDGHRWALAAEAIERCEVIGGDVLHLTLLKTIAVIDLFKERSGLTANFRLLQACLSDISKSELQKSLDQLGNWSLIIFRKFLDAYVVFAGSDFDIEETLGVALQDVHEIDFAALKTFASLQPLLAKRHYHDTGALRWFDVNLIPICDVLQEVTDYKPRDGLIGQFLLTIATEGEGADQQERLCREAVLYCAEEHIVIGISQQSRAIVTLARELIALENVRNDHPELQGDAVGRREVEARLVVLQSMLESELHEALGGALWFRKHHEPKQYRHAELNSLASELADVRFCDCPHLHNELLNRHSPSSSAIAGQNELLRRMVLNKGEERLGIQGYPAEGGLLASVLEATGLYRKSEDSWRFVPPLQGDPDDCRLAPMWEVATNYVRSHATRTIAVSEIYDLWGKAPYGVKDGLMPVLSVAFILSQGNNLAVYREGIFRARFDDVDVQYLAKDPAIIQLRWMDISDVSRRVLSGMADIVRTFDQKNTLAEPIDVARGLIAIYGNLPLWTQRTMRLSKNGVHVRDLFKRARDPNKFLFDDIPAIREDNSIAKTKELERIISDIRDGTEELVQAYPSMLRRMRDMMLTELQVLSLSPESLAKLHDRAVNIRHLAGDFHLDAFVGRLLQFEGTNSGFEEIASLAASKPPRDWTDPDMDRAAIDITELAQKFLRAETFARVKGRPEKRHAMAIVIGINGRRDPLLAEFDIADADRAAVNELVVRVSATLKSSNAGRRSVILAALAELSVRYMRDPDEEKANEGLKVEHHE